MISAAGRKFRAEVTSYLSRLGMSSVSAPIYLEIEMYPPDKRRRDVDNILKPVLDALQHGGVYDDDSQVVGLWIVRKDVVPRGALIVRVIREAA